MINTTAANDRLPDLATLEHALDIKRRIETLEGELGETLRFTPRVVRVRRTVKRKSVAKQDVPWKHTLTAEFKEASRKRMLAYWRRQRRLAA